MQDIYQENIHKRLGAGVVFKGFKDVECKQGAKWRHAQGAFSQFKLEVWWYGGMKV